MANMTIKEAIKWQEAFKNTYKGFPKESEEACDMAIRALKAYKPKKQFVLCETVEREIATPEFFDSYEDAYREMKDRLLKATEIKDDDELAEYEGDAMLDEWSAYCENANHDNCDWKIFEISE